MRQIYVQPGEVHWSAAPCVFKTVLGSCISVCLWDPMLGIGGINHFVLPRRRSADDDARFGDVAIPRLIDMLNGLGCTGLVGKLFGGAAVLPAGTAITVGDSNTELAVALLRHHRIPVVAQRTGGVQGVVISFSSATGEVMLREIPDEPRPSRSSRAPAMPLAIASPAWAFQ